jgi:hypothetical protein
MGIPVIVRSQLSLLLSIRLLRLQSIYPSKRFEDAYKSSTPLTYVAIVGCTFALMIIVFFVYDGVVERRNRKIVQDAARSNEIVTSMFPGALRDKIMNQKKGKGSSNKNKKSKQLALMLERQHGQSMSLRNLTMDDSGPLAELHSETTIMVREVPLQSKRRSLIATVAHHGDQLHSTIPTIVF